MSTYCKANPIDLMNLGSRQHETANLQPGMYPKLVGVEGQQAAAIRGLVPSPRRLRGLVGCLRFSCHPAEPSNNQSGLRSAIRFAQCRVFEPDGRRERQFRFADGPCLAAVGPVVRAAGSHGASSARDDTGDEHAGPRCWHATCCGLRQHWKSGCAAYC